MGARRNHSRKPYSAAFAWYNVAAVFQKTAFTAHGAARWRPSGGRLEFDTPQAVMFRLAFRTSQGELTHSCSI